MRSERRFFVLFKMSYSADSIGRLTGLLYPVNVIAPKITQEIACAAITENQIRSAVLMVNQRPMMLTRIKNAGKARIHPTLSELVKDAAKGLR